MSSKNSYVVCVNLLDNTLIECTLTADSTGQECLENIAQRIELNEVCCTLHATMHWQCIYSLFFPFVFLWHVRISSDMRVKCVYCSRYAHRETLNL